MKKIIAKTSPRPTHLETTHRLARRTLFGFILTFLIARVCVFLIMSGEMPNMYFFLKGTHVHHLNYGIFLLSAVAGVSVFRRPTGRTAEMTALVYGIALALTFDEFGMWLHLGGSYWQRASWDAVAVIAASLGLCAYGPALTHYRPRHRVAAALLLALVLTFFYFLARSFEHAERVVLPMLERIEQQAPR
ncbi:MAG: hypothetical protein ACREIC_33650 [Limisphaerales bacterium]